MTITPHPWSPYIIGFAQFPDEDGSEYIVKHPDDGRILNYFPTFEAARQYAMNLKQET